MTTINASTSAAHDDTGGTNFFTINIIVAITSLLFFLYTSKKQKKSKKASVHQLSIYPIKSCAEIHVQQALVTSRGFQYDRIFQVVSNNITEDDNDEVWTYCTPRDKRFERLFHIQPSISDDGKTMTLSNPITDGDYNNIIIQFKANLGDLPTSQLVVTVMGDAKYRLDDYGKEVADWLVRAANIVDTPCRLVGITSSSKKYNRQVKVNPDQGDELPTSSPPISLADEAPFLLTSNESLHDLNKRLTASGKDKVDMRRFRPNIVIKGLKPWEEDTFKRVRIGSVEFYVWQRCGRCTMTTIDRDTLERCGEPLKALSAFREMRANGQRNFGMHLIPVMESLGDDSDNNVMVGGEIEVLEYDEERRKEWMHLFR